MQMMSGVGVDYILIESTSKTLMFQLKLGEVVPGGGFGFLGKLYLQVLDVEKWVTGNHWA